MDTISEVLNHIYIYKSDWIDFVKLILNKSEWNIKWFMFERVCKKVGLTINLDLNHCRSQKQQIRASSRINFTNKTNSPLNQSSKQW